MKNYFFTSESVTEGHPDKVADLISDNVANYLINQNESHRTAIETMVSSNMVTIAGEVKTDLMKNTDSIEELVRQTVKDIGYEQENFHWKTLSFKNLIHNQSVDIARGTDDFGAGDQGMMFGYACDETEALMPLPIQVANRMAERHAEIRKAGNIPYLRPDGKTQVTFDYEDNKPVRLNTVLVSTQHNDGIDRDAIIRPDLIEHVIRPTIPEEYREDDYTVLVNPTGRFVVGGPVGDAGLTGRKIIVDTYGGIARHGGGAFSGKDPSKVDRSAAYATRWVAKNIVSAGAASRCEVQVAYAIGMARPVSILVETFGTEKVDPVKIEDAIQEIFDLRPAAIINDLDLRRPIYKSTAAYGHFGREEFPWEQVNRADDVRSHLGLN